MHEEGYLQKVMKIIDAREVKDMDEALDCTAGRCQSILAVSQVLLGSLYEACIRCGQAPRL